MAKKRIFWFLQQCEFFGGTEMVSFQLIKALKDDYDITVCLTYDSGAERLFDIPDNVNVKYLKYPLSYIRFDYPFNKLKEEKKYFKLCGLLINHLYNLLLKRFFTRRKVKKMTTKDDILIASSDDGYMIMPRGRQVYFHYHFNAKHFYSGGEKFIRFLSRKPDKYIFLCNTIYKEIVAKNKKMAKRSVYVLNPVRFTSALNDNYYNNSFVFLGRFVAQKNPMFLLHAMNELKKLNNNFVLTMYGEGPYETEMRDYIKENSLDNNIIIKSPTKDVLKALSDKDLLLVSSVYEGFSLAMLEANSQSVPVITTNWGDAVFEMIEDNKNGYVIKQFDAKEFANKVNEIISDKEMLLNMKRLSYEDSKNYQIDRIKKHWTNEIIK